MYSEELEMDNRQIDRGTPEETRKMTEFVNSRFLEKFC